MIITGPIDKKCQAALKKLNDELCSFSQKSGRGYTLILIPHSSKDEAMHVSLNGKPEIFVYAAFPEKFLAEAMKKRKR